MTKRQRSWSDDIDIKTIPPETVKAILQELVTDEMLRSERGRRNRLVSPGRKGVLAPCPQARRRDHDPTTCEICVTRAKRREKERERRAAKREE